MKRPKTFKCVEPVKTRVTKEGDEVSFEENSYKKYNGHKKINEHRNKNEEKKELDVENREIFQQD